MIELRKPIFVTNSCESIDSFFPKRLFCDIIIKPLVKLHYYSLNIYMRNVNLYEIQLWYE